MNEFREALDEIHERCQQDPQLSFIGELRKISPSKEWQTLLSDMDTRDTKVRERIRDTIRGLVQYQAKPEIAEAISSYHKNVVIPLLNALLDELTIIHAELAHHRTRPEGDEAESTT